MLPAPLSYPSASCSRRRRLYADNGGLTPVKPASENAQAIYDSYILILFVTGFVFVVVEATLIWSSSSATAAETGRARAKGPQVRGHTRIEVAWTIVPVAAARDHRRVRLREAARDRGRAGGGAPPAASTSRSRGISTTGSTGIRGGEIAVDDLVVP